MENFNTQTFDGKVKQAYKVIDSKSNSNVLIQSLSGAFGFPYTLIADVAVIFTHYAPLINDIRAIFDRKLLDDGETMTVIKKISKEILYDLVTDKILGQLPIAGIYFNAISAKAMTWRIGMLFAVLSSRGEEIDTGNVENVVKLIRNVFPQTDTLKFKKTDYRNFSKLVCSVNENNFETFNGKIEKALEAFE